MRRCQLPAALSCCFVCRGWHHVSITPLTHSYTTHVSYAGLGGDAFALFYDAKTKSVRGLAGNGAAPAGLTLDAVRAKVRCLHACVCDQFVLGVPGARFCFVSKSTHSNTHTRLHTRFQGVTGTELPLFSPLTVTVPGAAALWEDAVSHWGSGKMALADVLAPAVELAEGGWAVGPTTAWTWCR